MQQKCFTKALHTLNAMLKHRQNKDDATQLKNFLGLKLPPFFLHRIADRKRRQYQDFFQLNCIAIILTAL